MIQYTKENQLLIISSLGLDISIGMLKLCLFKAFTFGFSISMISL